MGGCEGPWSSTRTLAVTVFGQWWRRVSPRSESIARFFIVLAQGGVGLVRVLGSCGSW